MTGPKGKSEFCFPETLTVGTLRSRGNKTHYFPRAQSLSVLLYPNSKIEKNCEEIVCLKRAGSQIYRGFKEHDLITCESKVPVVVYVGS